MCLHTDKRQRMIETQRHIHTYTERDLFKCVHTVLLEIGNILNELHDHQLGNAQIKSKAPCIH